MRTLLTVFAKEFLENLRDRRTLLSALLFGPLFGPLLFGLMVSRMLEQSVVESDVPLKITISGGRHAPGLIRYLQGRGVKLTETELSENEARAAVRGGSSQVVLLVPEEYPKLFVAAQPAPLLLFADSADSQTRKIADRAKGMLATYGSTIAQLRLEMRGVSPLLSIPVAVNEVDVATPTGRAVVVLGFMTYFVLFALLMGGLYLAIDSTAGERERGSLEALLSLPVRALGIGGRQDSGDLRLHVHFIGLELDRLRLRVPLRAARAHRHERESGLRHGADFFRHLPAVRAARRHLDDPGGLLHPHLSRGADLSDHGAAGTDAADCLCQHLFAEDQELADGHPIAQPTSVDDQCSQG